MGKYKRPKTTSSIKTSGISEGAFIGVVIIWLITLLAITSS